MEGSAEIGAVDGCVAGGLGVVEIFAFRTVQLDGLLAGVVAETHGEEGLGFAEDAGAFAEVSFLVFVELGRMLVWCLKGQGTRKNIRGTYHLR